MILKNKKNSSSSGIFDYYPQDEVFSEKSESVNFLTFRSLQLHVKFQVNLMSHFGEKLFTHWHTDILTYWQWWFHRFSFSPKGRSPKINSGTPIIFEIYKFQKPDWVCLSILDQAHLKLHDQFVILKDMKLHAHNELYTSICFWDIKVLKTSFDMPGHVWPHPPNLTWSIYNFNRYEAACTKIILITPLVFEILKHFCSDISVEQR